MQFPQRPWRSWIAIGRRSLRSAGEDFRGHGQHYNDSRIWFREELDFPGPRTMNAARLVSPAACACPLPL